MTRKDYIAIARGLKRAYDIYNGSGPQETVGVTVAAGCIANELVNDNPRFDREHFLAVVRGEKLLSSRPAR